MPLGFERLNERTTRPNPLINFIKPLPGSSSDTAKDFLERIAAQCYPVMKANYIAVMALEEYEWNPEFIGRNFNAGEVIQLVLRSRSGAWLPFKYVQMTMMHELAHCKQMNHSKAFWAVRNAYAEEMRALWGRKYLGEGLWGKGQALETGRFMHDVMPDSADLPEHTCGGTYRRRGRKRKRGGQAGQAGQSGTNQLSYAERKQRRILKKFGDPTKANTLGTDEDVRVKLENGKKPVGKPRVAGSNRGRELRAAAALARFEQQTVKKEEIKQESETESDTEDEYDWPASDDLDSAPVQRDGKDFMRVCEAEDEDDVNVKREMEELNELHSIPSALSSKTSISVSKKANGQSKTGIVRTLQARRQANARADHGSGFENDTESDQRTFLPTELAVSAPTEGSDTESDEDIEAELQLTTKPTVSAQPNKSTKARVEVEIVADNTCPCCSMSNPPSAMVCAVCSNVLKPKQMPNHWRCQSDACRGGAYINVGDYGRCQVCGAAKQ